MAFDQAKCLIASEKCLGPSAGKESDVESVLTVRLKIGLGLKIPFLDLVVI